MKIILKDGQTLYDLLEERKRDIDYVLLEWRWDPYFSFKDTKFVLVTQMAQIPLYARFSAEKRSYQYSFSGPIDSAIKFANQYNVWDAINVQFKLDEGVLFAEHNEYNPEWNDYQFSFFSNTCWINIRYNGLYYFSPSSSDPNRRWVRYDSDTKGILARVEYDPETETTMLRCIE